MVKEKIKKVMFLNPANTMSKDSARRLTTPLGLMYLGKSLKQHGYKVKILDSPCEGYNNLRENGDYVTYGLSDNEVMNRIREYNPDLVGVNISSI